MGQTAERWMSSLCATESEEEADINYGSLKVDYSLQPVSRRYRYSLLYRKANLRDRAFNFVYSMKRKKWK
jgi:hypothetical protein